MITQYENSVKALKMELYKIMWYMRGGVSIDDIFNTSASDRSLMIDIINENLKTTKDTGIAFV